MTDRHAATVETDTPKQAQGAPDKKQSGSRVETYEEKTSTLMLVLAMLFLVAFATSVIWPDMPQTIQGALEVLQLGLWIVFVVDFIVRIFLADRRLHYFVTHPIDVVTVFLPMLRVLRVLRVFTALRLVAERGAKVAFGQVWMGLALAILLLALVGSLVVLQAERGQPGANIQTFPDAIWWAFVTMTTVGYGDAYPVTMPGRVSAVMLMLIGIGVLGSVTATMAAWFTEKIQGKTQDDYDDINTHIADLKQQNETLVRMIESLSADVQSLRAQLAVQDSNGQRPPTQPPVSP